MLQACSAGGTTQLSGASSGSGSGSGQGGAGGTVSVGTGGSSTGTGGTVSVGGTTGSNGELFCAGTSLSGTVFAPSGTLPLYNVVVYVPSEALAPIAEGASCETCDGNFSGKPVAAVMSDATGKFTLDLSEVPTATDLPLVVQIGKWRRELTVSDINPCVDNPLEDGFVRLPANQSEGNLPKIAVARGASDSLECLFRKIGISDSEFTTDAGAGRIHLYASDAGSDPSTHFADGTPMPHPSTLYSDLTKMMGYDVVFMACEGDGRGSFEEYDATVFTNIHTYANQGGRIFGSHYHNYWVRPDKFDELEDVVTYPEVATFASSQHGFEVDQLGSVDTSFPKGQALYDWLGAVGGLDAAGKLVIHDGEHTVDAVMPGVSTAWISVDPDVDGHNAVQYFSFNTPIGGAECGRMVFSDLHVGAGSGDSGKVDFPNGCVSADLTPQQKALAFMLFDLSSCVQPDGAEPPDPVVVK